MCAVNGLFASSGPGVSFDFETVATDRWLSLRYPTSDAQKVPLVSPGSGLLCLCFTRPTIEVAMSFKDFQTGSIWCSQLFVHPSRPTVAGGLQVTPLFATSAALSTGTIAYT